MSRSRILFVCMVGIFFFGCAEKSPIQVKQLGIDDPDRIPPVLTSVRQIGDRIRITWIDNVMNETGFRVYRKIKDYEYSQIADVVPNTKSYTDSSTFQDGTTYLYYVETYGPGVSQPSNEMEITYMETPGFFWGFEDGQLPPAWSAQGWYVTDEDAYEGNWSIRCLQSYWETHYLETTPIDVPENTYIYISFATREGDASGDGDLYINGYRYLDWDMGTYWYPEGISYNSASDSQIILKWEYDTYSYGYAYLDSIHITW